MTTVSCIAVTLLVIVLLPLHLLWWATESRHTRINRLRRRGHTWAAIASHYGVSTTTARRWAESSKTVPKRCAIAYSVHS